MFENDTLRYYIELCRCRNFTSAAEHLYISQPALSRYIQKLEDELGIVLIERTNRSFVLTSAGKELFKMAEDYQEQERIFWEKARSLKRGFHANIKLGYGDSLTHSCLLNATQLMHFKNPNVIIEVTSHPQGMLLPELMTGRIDVAYVLRGYLGNQSGITYETITEGPLAVLASNCHKYYGRNSLSIEELENERIYFNGWNGPITHTVVVDFLKEHNIKIQNDSIDNSFSEQLFRVVNGTCLSLTHMLGNELFDTSPACVKRIPIKDSVFPAGALCVAYTKKSKEIEEFVSCIKEYAPSFQLD